MVKEDIRQLKKGIAGPGPPNGEVFSTRMVFGIWDGLLLGLALVLPVIAGCAASRPETRQAVVPLMEAGPLRQEETTEYVLHAGDEIEIKFFDAPELNERIVIRPDGRVSFGLINELEVAGTTVARLREIITSEYGKLYKDVRVAVIVREFASQLVYISGEVATPRVMPLKGSLTALQSIGAAGGFTNHAKASDVLIIRNDRGKPFVFKVDLERVLARGEGDVLLQPQDIVYVPKTLIAKVDLFVEQYINQIIPRAVSVTFPFNMYLGTLKTKNVDQPAAVQAAPALQAGENR